MFYFALRRPDHVRQRALHGAKIVLVVGVLGGLVVPVVNGETELLKVKLRFIKGCIKLLYQVGLKLLQK